MYPVPFQPAITSELSFILLHPRQTTSCCLSGTPPPPPTFLTCTQKSVANHILATRLLTPQLPHSNTPRRSIPSQHTSPPARWTGPARRRSGRRTTACPRTRTSLMLTRPRAAAAPPFACLPRWTALTVDRMCSPPPLPFRCPWTLPFSLPCTATRSLQCANLCHRRRLPRGFSHCHSGKKPVSSPIRETNTVPRPRSISIL